MSYRDRITRAFHRGSADPRPVSRNLDLQTSVQNRQVTLSASRRVGLRSWVPVTSIPVVQIPGGPVDTDRMKRRSPSHTATSTSAERTSPARITRSAATTSLSRLPTARPWATVGNLLPTGSRLDCRPIRSGSWCPFWTPTPKTHVQVLPLGWLNSAVLQPLLSWVWLRRRSRHTWASRQPDLRRGHRGAASGCHCRSHRAGPVAPLLRKLTVLGYRIGASEHLTQWVGQELSGYAIDATLQHLLERSAGAGGSVSRRC